jgi:sterol 3beta-glucosyltransferase
MQITLIAFGSRGDVQPAVALAKGIQAAGYDIRVAAGKNFESWIQSHGLKTVSFNVDVEAMMNSAEGQAWVESGDNPYKEMRRMQDMYARHGGQIAHDLDSIMRDSDMVISGFVTFPVVQTLNETYRKPHIVAQLQPITPSRDGATQMNTFLSGRSIINLAGSYIQQFFMWQLFRPMVNQLRRELKLPTHSARTFIREWNITPIIYGFSPLVVPRPPEWQPHVQTAGYWFLDEPAWSPPDALVKFLAAGSKPVYIGFGSMSNRDPQKTLQLIVEALRQSGQRGVIASGWANLSGVDLPESIHMLSSAPHSWLFPRMAGVIHHGGAGTTAAGLRAGVPTGIIPHFTDQPYWGRRVYELGVGAKPVHRSKLTVEKLAAMISTLVTDTRMQEASTRLGERLRAEDGVKEAVRILADFVKRTG